MRSKLLSVLLLFTLLLAACTPQATAAPTAAPTAAEAATQAPAPTQEPTEVQPRTLTVLAAASLTESFTELGKMFEAQNPGVTVSYSFAGSQQLAQQLGQGAEADVFASANNKQMTAVVDAGRVDKDAPQVFVKNRLVVIYPKDNPPASRPESLANPASSWTWATNPSRLGSIRSISSIKRCKTPTTAPVSKMTY